MTLPWVIVTWLALLILLAVEYFTRMLPGGATAAPFIGMAMMLVVAMSFMRLAATPGVAGVFALAAVFWLAVMMGLGTLDPMTRHDIPVSMHTEP